jgi:hypothetical protein
MADLYEEDEEFAAAVDATWSQIDPKGTGAIDLGMFVDWWQAKETASGEGDLADSVLDEASVSDALQL